MKIIAEIGQNHNGDMGLARDLIVSAKENGADVAKFQVYNAYSLFSKEGNPWFEYNCKTELSHEDVEVLAGYCRDIGIEFMASVFDVERVSWLECQEVRNYKIASRSIHDIALIAAIAETNKPVLVSLGMWEEDSFPDLPIQDVQYLYCISKYPTPLKDIQLSKIDFDEYSGFSDHSIGISASVAAFVCGAKIVEKHYTLDKSSYGPDHKGSMTPNELKQLSTMRDEFMLCL